MGANLQLKYSALRGNCICWRNDVESAGASLLSHGHASLADDDRAVAAYRIRIAIDAKDDIAVPLPLRARCDHDPRCAARRRPRALARDGHRHRARAAIGSERARSGVEARLTSRFRRRRRRQVDVRGASASTRNEARDDDRDRTRDEKPTTHEASGMHIRSQSRLESPQCTGTIEVFLLTNAVDRAPQNSVRAFTFSPRRLPWPGWC